MGSRGGEPRCPSRSLRTTDRKHHLYHVNLSEIPLLSRVKIRFRNYSAGMADVRQGGTIGLPAKTLVNASMTLPPFLRMVEM